MKTLTFRKAMNILVSGNRDLVADAWDIVAAEVWPLCETPTEGLEEWISGGDYDSYCSAKSLAQEWDAI